MCARVRVPARASVAAERGEAEGGGRELRLSETDRKRDRRIKRQKDRQRMER